MITNNVVLLLHQHATFFLGLEIVKILERENWLSQFDFTEINFSTVNTYN